MSARKAPKRGMILILVLVVTVALCLAALAFSRWMWTEREAVNVAGRQAQTRALALSGLESVQLFLSRTTSEQNDAGGWYDNLNYFSGVLVLDDPQVHRRGRFSVVAPTWDEEDGNDIRFGLDDESAKLNLNTLMAAEAIQKGAGRQLLMALPNMTEEIADAILDWLDSDDEVRENGAESDVYATMDPAYAPANGPLETLEQLLLVRGVTPELLFGVDANRNGYADDTEPNPGELSDSSGSSMDCGWARYLTLHSCETNVRADGTARINVNMSDLEALNKALQEAVDSDWANFIIAYRQQDQSQNNSNNNSPPKTNDSGRLWGSTLHLVADASGPPPGGGGGRGGGGRGGHGEGGGGRGGRPGEASQGGSNSQGNQPQVAETKASGQLDLTQPGKTRINSLLDLIGQQVQVKYKGRSDKALLASPFKNDVSAMRDYLPKLMDLLTTDEAKVVAGRININLAPRPVLAGIPGMPEEAIDKILGQRQKDPLTADAEHRSPTWLLTEGILTLPQMKQVFPFVTGGGAVFRGQVVGYFDAEGTAARIEAVFDATQAPARIVFWRELTPLGRGYPLDLLGAQP